MSRELISLNQTKFEHVCICGMCMRVRVDVIYHGRMIRNSAQTTILSGSLFASQFLMSLSALLNIMRSTALDFGHRVNSRLSSDRITFRKICLASLEYRKPHAPGFTRHTHSTQSTTLITTRIFPTECFFTSPTQK